MDNPARVEEGKPLREFPGRSFNALVDDLNFRRAHGSERNDAGSAKATAQILVSVHNGTTGGLQPGDVLGFDDPQFEPTGAAPDPAYHWPAVKGVTPDATDHKDQFVLLVDGIGEDAVGRAVLLGLAWARVNWTDAGHTHVKVATGETQLQSATSGIKPVWHETIPGGLPADVWALIMLDRGEGGGSTIRLARALEDIDGALNNLVANWGTGTVAFMDDATGVLDCDPTTVDNPLIEVDFVTDAQLVIDTSFDPPRIINGTCAAVTWVDPDCEE